MSDADAGLGDLVGRVPVVYSSTAESALSAGCSSATCCGPCGVRASATSGRMLVAEGAVDISVEPELAARHGCSRRHRARGRRPCDLVDGAAGPSDPGCSARRPAPRRGPGPARGFDDDEISQPRGVRGRSSSSAAEASQTRHQGPLRASARGPVLLGRRFCTARQETLHCSRGISYRPWGGAVLVVGRSPSPRGGFYKCCRVRTLPPRVQSLPAAVPSPATVQNLRERYQTSASDIGPPGRVQVSP